MVVLASKKGTLSLAPPSMYRFYGEEERTYCQKLWASVFCVFQIMGRGFSEPQADIVGRQGSGTTPSTKPYLALLWQARLWAGTRACCILLCSLCTAQKVPGKEADGGWCPAHIMLAKSEAQPGNYRCAHVICTKGAV